MKVIELTLPSDGDTIPEGGWTIISNKESRLYYGASGHLFTQSYSDLPQRAHPFIARMLGIPDQIETVTTVKVKQ
jgi:hypothetical protein